MKLTKRERVLLIMVAVVTLAALYYLYYLSPKMEEIATLNQSIGDLEIEIIDLNQQIAQIPVKENELEELKEKAKPVYQRFLSGWDEPLLLAGLENLVGNSMVKTSISFSEIEELPHYTRGLVSFSLLSGYDDLMKAIDKLESSLYYNEIRKISIRDRSIESSIEERQETEPHGSDPEIHEPEIPDPETEDEEEVPETAVAQDKHDLEVGLDILFYSINREDPFGLDYDFMDENYKKHNIFAQ
ncbi:MAG: hypothetical protein GX352_09910 [Clostridiales bacterium]|nr:hypothetical protein [Clostridiales bacterium]